MKWTVFKIILISLVLFIVAELVLWRNLIPEHFFSIYSDRMHVDGLDVVVFLDKDVMPSSFHGDPVHFNVWVKSGIFSYVKSHSVFLGRYNDVCARSILPYYEYFSDKGAVKFVSVANGTRYRNEQEVHMLVRGRENILFALTVTEKMLDTLGTVANKCSLCFPEKESCGQADYAKNLLEIKELTKNDLSIGEEIRYVASQYTWRTADCLDSLFQRPSRLDESEGDPLDTKMKLHLLEMGIN